MAEWQNNAGITEKSPASVKLLLHPGVRACSCCFAGAFLSCTPQPCPAFWTKPAWSQFSLVPSSLWGFEAMSEELHEPMKPVRCFLAVPAFTCAPQGLAAPSPSRSAPPPSPSCQGSLPPLSQRGAKAFVFETTVNQGRLLPSRLCGPLLQYVAVPRAWGEAIAGCAGACPSVSTGSETPSSSHSNILRHFQGKDWIPRSSVLQLLFK